jgi:putative addiction module component (TIGR02574 family)
MMRDAAELLRAALALPAEVRASLAGHLIASLDTDMDEGAEDAWSAEIARRVREIESGDVPLVPWTEVRRRLLAQ